MDGLPRVVTHIRDPARGPFQSVRSPPLWTPGAW
jgi:hypothetical protein